MDGLREAVKAAVGRGDVRAAVREVYAALQRDIDLRRPVCRASGRCCRFESYGHRLYVTTMELAAFVAEVREMERPAPAAGRGGPLTVLPLHDGCPYQVDGLCGVHAIRPFGCRVFFCDASSDEWQSERYEHYHAKLRLLHEQMDVRYYYVEWRRALEALGMGEDGLLSRGKVF